MNSKALLPPIPVRFSPETKRRIRHAARKFGVAESYIIRCAVDLQLPMWERSGKIVLAPIP